MIVELIDDFFADYSATAGFDNVDSVFRRVLYDD